METEERRADMSDMATNIALMQQSIEESTTITRRLDETIRGNGTEGLVTKVAVVRASLKRAWWFIAAIFVLLTGVGVKAAL